MHKELLINSLNAFVDIFKALINFSKSQPAFSLYKSRTCKHSYNLVFNLFCIHHVCISKYTVEVKPKYDCSAESKLRKRLNNSSYLLRVIKVKPAEIAKIIIRKKRNILRISNICSWVYKLASIISMFNKFIGSADSIIKPLKLFS